LIGKGLKDNSREKYSPKKNAQKPPANKDKSAKYIPNQFTLF